MAIHIDSVVSNLRIGIKLAIYYNCKAHKTLHKSEFTLWYIKPTDFFLFTTALFGLPFIELACSNTVRTGQANAPN